MPSQLLAITEIVFPTSQKLTILLQPLGLGSSLPACHPTPNPHPWGLFLLASVVSGQAPRMAWHAQSCLILCDPMDCGLPRYSVHGILSARILEWVAIPFSRGSSRLRDRTWVSCIAGRFFTIWATRKAQPHQTCKILGVYPWWSNG